MNILTRTLMASLACLLAAACATVPAPAPAPTAAALGALFADANMAKPSEAPTAENLFALSGPMKAYLNSKTFQDAVQTRGAEMGLVDALYAKESLKLDYDDSVTRDAAATFASRRGNCLSLVIMTAAFAKALKLDVRFQDVRISADWSRNGNLYVGSNHVNLSVAAPAAVSFSNFQKLTNRITIDFVPSSQAGEQSVRKLSENMIKAMYLNNRAVEELEHQRFDNAYWWARAAIVQEPGYTAAHNTLGVIYHRRGDSGMAERVFAGALARTPQDPMLMKNLVPVLEHLGKGAEARILAAQVAALDPEPPLHFFESGIRAMEAGQYLDAKKLFAREADRSPFNHELHYWLGLAHLRLGEAQAARKELTIALSYSNSVEASHRYSSKLAYLRSLNY